MFSCDRLVPLTVVQPASAGAGAGGGTEGAARCTGVSHAGIVVQGARARTRRRAMRLYTRRAVRSWSRRIRAAACPEPPSSSRPSRHQCSWPSGRALRRWRRQSCGTTSATCRGGRAAGARACRHRSDERHRQGPAAGADGGGKDPAGWRRRRGQHRDDGRIASRISERFATFDAKASFAELFGSAVINPSVRTYRGTYSERIRIDAYQTLNQLLRGDLRQAAVCVGGAPPSDSWTPRWSRPSRSTRWGTRSALERGHRRAAGAGRAEGQAPDRAGRRPALRRVPGPLPSWISGIAWCSTGDAQEFRQGVSNIQEALQMMPENGVLRAQLAANPFELARQGRRRCWCSSRMASPPITTR